MTAPADSRAHHAPSPLGRALDRACGSRAIPGNAVRPLDDAPAALEAMLDIIRGATRWIHFENYIIRGDRTGGRFADALADAAARGVQTRVLYDVLGCRGTSRRYWRRLREAGVDVVGFHRLNPLRPIRSIRRDHRKYVAGDGGRAIVGGMCVGDEWAGTGGTHPVPWRDTAVEVRGPAVPALDLSFRRLWKQAGGVQITEQLPVEPVPRGDALVRVIDGVPGKLRLVRAIEFLAASALERIWITDAYLVPPMSLYATLLAAARDGADVRILVPGRTDLPLVRTLTRVGYRELLEAGARIWEWHGPMLHAKTVLVDDVWFKVGSSNLNPSSLFSNYEIDLLIEDPESAAQAADQFRRDLAGAVPIVLRPARLTRRLPPAVVAETDETGEVRDPRPLTHRAAVTVRQVAGGARRSIAGAALFTAVGAGALFLALPRLMAYLLSAGCFLLAVVGAWHFFTRRRHRAG